MKFLLIAALVGALVLAAALAQVRRLEARVVEFVAECERERVQRPALKELGARLICSPALLRESAGPGIQGEIGRAERQRAFWDGLVKPAAAVALGLAIVLLVLFWAVPWLWYFLLDRIRELRQAIVGK